tara:strand:- start:101 stop:598 length:498 start_codon:yes stop_codon:yes gene_type:complete
VLSIGHIKLNGKGIDMAEPKSIEELGGQSLEDYTSGTTSIKELDSVVNKLRKNGVVVSPQVVANIANQRIKRGQYKTEPSVFGKGLKALLNYFSPTDPKQAPSQSSQMGSDKERKKQIKDTNINKALKNNRGGSITKNRIGGNDYRKGGYVLNTTDNRKVKRNGK